MIQTERRCGVFACDRPQVGQGLCDLHYRRMRRHGHLHRTRPKDWGERSAHPLYGYWNQIRRNGTPLCESWHTDFWSFVRDVGERPSDLHFLYRPDKAIPMGERNAIWSVSKGGPPRDAEHTAERRTRKEEMRDYLRGRRGGDPFYDLRIGLKVAHGISLEDFERMLDSQDGVCAICGRPEHRRSTTAGRAYRLAVDHERGTATIRGLLCSMCNHAIGYLDDSPELLERAIAYLRDPPAAKLGIAHNGKHKTRRIERQPSPHLERHVKPQIAREEVKPIIFPLSTAAGEHKAAQDRGLAESFRQTREACPPSDPRPKGGSWGISLLWNAGGEKYWARQDANGAWSLQSVEAASRWETATEARAAADRAPPRIRHDGKIETCPASDQAV